MVNKEYSFEMCIRDSEWTEEVDEIQFDITKIKNKLKELTAQHDKHLNRPTFDDNADEEQQINLLTQNITQVNCNN